MRSGPEYEKVRKEVVKRDKGKCRFPGCKAKGREMHHIIPYSRSAEMRLESKNLIMLCKKHHKQVTGKEIHYMGMFLDIIC